MAIEFNSRNTDNEKRVEEQRKIPCFIDKDRRTKDRRTKDRRKLKSKEFIKTEIKRIKFFKRCLNAQR